MIRVMVFYIISITLVSSNLDTTTTETVESEKPEPLPDTRRILKGSPTGITRPYMVYLRPIDRLSVDDPTWTCGGVIIHPYYILTSAACIEDAKQFLVVSGTHKWVRNDETTECIEYGAIKAVSKCVTKEFVFDGHEFDNTKWMRDDIAIVKLEDKFNFQKRVRGCDYIPQVIPINNVSLGFETPGTIGSIAGWGTISTFDAERTANNSMYLLEVDVKIITARRCKTLWPARYHHIIDHNVICSQDSSHDVVVMCGETNCADNKEFGLINHRRAAEHFDSEALHFQKFHNNTKNTRRAFVSGGGFCNNDHGGPLVVGQGKNAVVIGLISACQHNSHNHRCYGPFLYTSVWKNKHLISCVLGDKTCEQDKWMSCCALEEEKIIRVI